MSLRRMLLVCGSLLALTAGSASARAADDIKLGGLVILEGPFAILGEEALRGVKVAIDEFGGEINGRKLVLSTASSNGNPDTAVNGARKLVEQDKVDVLIGPVSGSEGLAVRDYSRSHPEVTFVNGASAAQDTTLRDPSPNFFRFGGDGVQWQAGLGESAAKDLGYHRVAIVAEDYSFPYTMVEGFMLGFCKNGGHVPAKVWVPIGNQDFSSAIYSLPDDIDAVYVALGGSDAVNFLTQYSQAGGTKPIIGSAVSIDQAILDSKGPFRERLPGTPSVTPVPSNYDAPEWKVWVDAYHKKFPDGLTVPDIFGTYYYVATKAALLALRQVNGDLSNGQKAYRDALAKLEFVTPTGPVKLDHNRQGIVNAFLTRVEKNPDGSLGNKVVKVFTNVNQTLGIPEDEFLKLGPVSRDNPQCP